MKIENDNANRPAAQDEIISLSEIARMILRHKVKIAVFTVLVTTFTAVLSFLSPRAYKAEGLLQVIPPVTVIDDKIDRDLFETIIISRLETIQSAFIMEEVYAALNPGTGAQAGSELQARVKISRPPKSNLIVITAVDQSAEGAVAIIRTWIQKYLASIRYNNVQTALAQVRTMLKKAQAGLMEAQAKAEQMKTHAEEIKPLIDVARGIDNQQLWRELADNAAPEKLKNLAQMHIRGQEQNSDYLTAKALFYNADQVLAAAIANRNYFQAVENYLEFKARAPAEGAVNPAQFPSNAVQFAETMLKSTDVIEVGKPALKSSARGASRKILITFLGSLLAAALCAYLAEWLKTIKI